jgi:tRNA modification GTPase
MAPGERRAGSDTIAAIATPPGRGAIGIIRLSGDGALGIAQTITGLALQPRHAHYAPFRDRGNNVVDHGIALYFPKPRSFTGEDVVEFQTHGSPAVLDRLLNVAVMSGARAARPGEFTERAFLNGRLDLAQAEAVADLISSASDQAARAALGSLQGEFSRQVNELIDTINAVRAETEARLDFPDDTSDPPSVLAAVSRIIDRLESIMRDARRGVVLQEGVDVAIVGRPNAGKSSLLNRIARRDRAIVSPLPGTTRDTVTADVLLNGCPVSFTDTAGLRSDADLIEREGIRRTREALSRADHVLLLVPHGEATLAADRDVMAALPAGAKLTLIRSKIDLAGEAPRRRPANAEQPFDEIWISAVHDSGLDLIETQILEAAGQLDAPEGAFSARRRHLDALAQARDVLAAAAVPGLAPELIAENLRLARQALEAITGAYTNEDLLGEIFASFCIGK